MTALPHFIDMRVVAEILAELGAEIEQMGVTLCLDPAISVNHIATLQNIDLIAQKQRGLAAILESDCSATALDEIKLEYLQLKFGLI